MTRRGIVFCLMVTFEMLKIDITSIDTIGIRAISLNTRFGTLKIYVTIQRSKVIAYLGRNKNNANCKNTNVSWLLVLLEKRFRKNKTVLKLHLCLKITNFARRNNGNFYEKKTDYVSLLHVKRI